jgi:hypothetical protein
MENSQGPTIRTSAPCAAVDSFVLGPFDHPDSITRGYSDWPLSSYQARLLGAGLAGIGWRKYESIGKSNGEHNCAGGN